MLASISQALRWNDQVPRNGNTKEIFHREDKKLGNSLHCLRFYHRRTGLSLSRERERKGEKRLGGFFTADDGVISRKTAGIRCETVPIVLLSVYLRMSGLSGNVSRLLRDIYTPASSKIIGHLLVFLLQDCAIFKRSSQRSIGNESNCNNKKIHQFTTQ